MIKLIASDMDGTLVSSNHCISSENILAIKEAQSRGIEFIISTGRSFEDARRQVEASGILCNYLVMNGGELRSHTGEVIRKHYLDKAIVKDIVGELLEYDLCVEIYTSAGIFALGTENACKYAVAAKINNFHPELTIEEAFQNVTDHFLYKELQRNTSLQDILSSDIEIGKIITFTPNKKLISKLREEIPSRYFVNASGSFAINLEITSPLADKGQALSNYAESKGISLSEVMTLGDSFNDVSMFNSSFGYTVAMGNAIPEIKALAKYVTDTNDNDGVGKAILKFI